MSQSIQSHTELQFLFLSWSQSSFCSRGFRISHPLCKLCTLHCRKHLFLVDVSIQCLVPHTNTLITFFILSMKCFQLVLLNHFNSIQLHQSLSFSFWTAGKMLQLTFLWSFKLQWEITLIKLLLLFWLCFSWNVERLILCSGTKVMGTWYFSV